MRIVALALTLSFVTPAVGAQQPGDTRAYLLVIDDLHLDFRSTPRVRDLLQRLTTAVLGRDGDLAAIVSTGYSSISERPSSNIETVMSAINRVTGGGLRPEEMAAALTPPGDDRELGRRIPVSLSTALDALRNFGRVPAGRRAVIYVSNGHPVPVDSEQFDSVVRAANDARSPIYVFSVFDLVTAPLPQPDSDVWRQYVQDSREMLRQLAAATGGLMAINAGDLEHILNVLTN